MTENPATLQSATPSPFRDSFPLDFHLWGASGRPVLSTLAGDGQALTLAIINTSAGDVTLGDPAVGTLPCHFVLRFRKGTLLDPSNISVRGPDRSWEKVDQNENRVDNTVDEIWIKGPANHVIQRGHKLVLSLDKVQADPTGGTRSSRVEFVYQALRTAPGTRLLSGHREKTISIINRATVDILELPLHVGFAGPNTILNDGSNKNTLKLQLTNVAHNALENLKFTENSRLILSFDVEDKDANERKSWALGTTNDIKDIVPTLTGGARKKNGHPESQAGRQQWKFMLHDVLPQLENGKALELTIPKIASSLPTGPTNLYLLAENIQGYPDRKYVLTVQKTPLLFARPQSEKDDSPWLVGIGTTNPTHALHINGHDNALRLTGTGDHGEYAKLNFGDGEYVYLHEDTDDHLTIHASNMAVTASKVLAFSTGEEEVKDANGEVVEDEQGEPKIKRFERMRIDAEGHVGIRTQTPKLDLAIGDGDTGLKQQGENQLAFYTGNQERARIDSVGKVGIGTTYPKTTLDIRSNNPEVTVGTKKNTGGAIYFGDSSHGLKRTGAGVGLYTTGGDLHLSTVGETPSQLVLKNAGNVGIGTADPEKNAKLDVAGVVRAASFRPTNEMVHRMYPSDPKVYQDIFTALNDGAIVNHATRGYNDTGYRSRKWNHHPIISFGSNQAGYFTVTVPPGCDTVWLRVLGERWNAFEVYDNDKKKWASRWFGGYRSANCYCPDGSLTDGWQTCHQWMPIPVGSSGDHKIRLNIDGTGSENLSWLSGLAFSKNPWNHATQSAASYHDAVNGGDNISWATHNWNNDVLARLLAKTQYHLKVPVIPSGRDKLLYLVEYNDNWNGCMHKGITVGGESIERFLATYDNPFARHWNSKFYNRYIAARIPADMIPDGVHFLDVVVDMSNQDNHIRFREIGTHDLDVPDGV